VFSLVSRLSTAPDRAPRLGLAVPVGAGERVVPENGRSRDRSGLGSPSCRVGRWGLLAEPEALDGRAVALDVLPLQVVEQAAAAPARLRQSAASVVVLGVGLEVLGQRDDAMGRDRALPLGGAGVVVVR